MALANQENESWQIIKTHRNYQVSNMGRIRRWLQGKKIFKIVNHQVRAKDGYCIVVLRKQDIPTAHYVHRLVASAFCYNSNEVVNHIDGNKQNNSHLNLEWTSKKGNLNHAIVNRLMASGERVHGSKLKESDIKPIRDSELSLMKIAREYNVSKKTILNIKKKKVWKYV